MIYINGEPLESISNLTIRHQLILSMITNGKEWLRWAIKNQDIPDLKVESERQLLEAIQGGLHSDQYIRFKTFQASLSKFLQIPENDLENMAISAYGNGHAGPVPQQILTDNHILSYAELEAAKIFAVTEAGNAPGLFSAPSFSDLLVLTPFVTQLKTYGPKLKKSAMLFAQAEASSIPEYIDLFFFFAYAIEKQIPNGKKSALELSTVKQLYDHAMPIVNGLIFTPNVGKLNDPAELEKKLQPVIGANKFIGYETKQSALANLANNIQFGKMDEAELKMRIDQYLQEIKNMVFITKVPEGNLRQDGCLTSLLYTRNKTHIHLGVDEDGNVILLRDTQLKTH